VGANATPGLPSAIADIRLFGQVSEGMLSEFFRQQAAVPPNKPVVFELSTSGGDADVGRRIAQELRWWQEKEDREVYFLGKTYVYSAGVTIMSSIPCARRFLTGDCELLIHERKMKKQIHLEGALRGCRSTIQDVLAEIDSGQRLERDGFEQLIRGTRLTLQDVEQRVLERDWYLTAPQAKEVGLVADVL
jgi:ATP-dependent protease ClpP protease subunit